MMSQLVRNAGHYRQEGVGVFDSNGNCLHMAPPPAQVPELMGDLFHWVKTCKTHPLVYSCVFHYEFEFIHPFIDGNGRMGRYWQTMLLSKWKGIFAWIPVESIVKQHQQEYYNVIAKCDAAGESTLFIEFMLQCLLEAMENYEEAEEDEALPPDSAAPVERLFGVKFGKEFGVKFGVKFGVNEKQVLILLDDNPSLSAAEMSERIGISKRGIEKQLKKFKDLGVITRQGSDKTGLWIINK
jgi:Fic family protein